MEQRAERIVLEGLLEVGCGADRLRNERKGQDLQPSTSQFRRPYP